MVPWKVGLDVVLHFFIFSKILKFSLNLCAIFTFSFTVPLNNFSYLMSSSFLFLFISAHTSMCSWVSSLLWQATHSRLSYFPFKFTLVSVWISAGLLPYSSFLYLAEDTFVFSIHYVLICPLLKQYNKNELQSLCHMEEMVTIGRLPVVSIWTRLCESLNLRPVVS